MRIGLVTELLDRRKQMVSWALERWGVAEELAEEPEVALSVVEIDDDDEEREGEVEMSRSLEAAP